MSLKPVCVGCERFMRMKQAGYYFIEGMPKDSNQSPIGKGADDHWIPYKVWAGDLWECRTCGHQVISGLGQHPVAEHFEPDFADTIEKTRADRLMVKDC